MREAWLRWVPPNVRFVSVKIQRPKRSNCQFDLCNCFDGQSRLPRGGCAHEEGEECSHQEGGGPEHPQGSALAPINRGWSSVSMKRLDGKKDHKRHPSDRGAG